MSNHTSGPWSVERDIEFCDSSDVVAADGTCVAEWIKSQASAGLTAAAPDMLDFVKWVADRGKPNNQMEIFQRARLLVAKAEGRAP